MVVTTRRRPLPGQRLLDPKTAVSAEPTLAELANSGDPEAQYVVRVYLHSDDEVRLRRLESVCATASRY